MSEDTKDEWSQYAVKEEPKDEWAQYAVEGSVEKKSPDGNVSSSSSVASAGAAPSISDKLAGSGQDNRDAYQFYNQYREEKAQRDATPSMPDQQLANAANNVSSTVPREQPYLDALAKNPKDTKAANDLGAIYLSEGKTNDAANAFLNAIENNPRDAASRVGYSHILNQQEDFKKSIDNLDIAIKAAPQNAMAWTERAYAKSKSGDVKGALIDVAAAEHLDPDNPYHTKLKASILAKSGNQPRAVEEMVKADTKADNQDQELQNGVQKFTQGNKEMPFGLPSNTDLDLNTTPQERVYNEGVRSQLKFADWLSTGGVEGSDGSTAGKIAGFIMNPIGALATSGKESIESGASDVGAGIEKIKGGSWATGSLKALNGLINIGFGGMTATEGGVKFIAAMQAAPEPVKEALMSVMTNLYRPTSEGGKELAKLGDVIGNILMIGAAEDGNHRLFEAVKKKMAGEDLSPAEQQTMQEGVQNMTDKHIVDTQKVIKSLPENTTAAQAKEIFSGIGELEVTRKQMEEGSPVIQGVMGEKVSKLEEGIKNKIEEIKTAKPEAETEGPLKTTDHATNEGIEQQSDVSKREGAGEQLPEEGINRDEPPGEQKESDSAGGGDKLPEGGEEVIPATIGKEIEPHKEVKATVAAAAKDLGITNGEAQLYEKIKDVAGDDRVKAAEDFVESAIDHVDHIKANIKKLEGWIENGQGDNAINKAQLKEGKKRLKQAEKLLDDLSAHTFKYKNGDVSESVYIEELDPLVERLNNRLETRKAVKAGTDLFPEDANIPEFKAIHNELNTDNGTINNFKSRTAEQVKLAEPAIADIESNAENAEGLSREELESGISAADKLIKDSGGEADKSLGADSGEADTDTSKEPAKDIAEGTEELKQALKNAERIRSKKIGGNNLYAVPDFGLTKTIYNSALEFCASQVEKGTSLGKAINNTIVWIDEHMKGVKWEKGIFARHLNDKYTIKLNGKETEVQRVEDKPTAKIINGFYSPLEDGINKASVEKTTGKEWAKKLSGVTEGDELKYTGMDKFLEENKDKALTKKDLQDYMRNNRVEIVEVVKGDKANNDNLEWKKWVIKNRNKFSDINIDDHHTVEDLTNSLNENDEGIYISKSDLLDRNPPQNIINSFDNSDTYINTKYHQYQLPGEKSNYKEVLITLPNKKPLSFDEFKTAAQKETALDDIEVKSAYKKYIASEDFGKLDPNKFKSSHFDEPNILAHLRMNVREGADGKKTLFIEELQSDWGQKGKREGFQGDIPDGVIEKNEKGGWKIKDGDRTMEALSFSNRADAETYFHKHSRLHSNVPSAPYIASTPSWVKLGLKYALKHAADEGADRIAWTTGEQQNDRYDLSKQVDYIERGEQIGIDKEKGTFQLNIGMPTKLINLDVNEKTGIVERQKGSADVGDFEGKHISDIIGKDIAEKVMSGGAKKYEREGLKIGGKGMIGFYGSPGEGKLGIVGDVAEGLLGKGSVKTTEIGNFPKEVNEGYAKSDFIKWAEDKFGDEYSENYLNASYDNQDGYVYHKWEDTFPADATKQHSINITPELKASIQEGIPLFKSLRGRELIAEGVRDLVKIANHAKSGVNPEAFGALYKIAKGLMQEAGTSFDNIITKLKEHLKDALGYATHDVDKLVDPHIAALKEQLIQERVARDSKKVSKMLEEGRTPEQAMEHLKRKGHTEETAAATLGHAIENTPSPEERAASSEEVAQKYLAKEKKWLGNKETERIQGVTKANEYLKEIKDSVAKNGDWKRALNAIHLYNDIRGLTPEEIAELKSKIDPVTHAEELVDLAWSQNLNDAQKAIADKMEADYKALGEKALKENVIRDLRDNYVNRAWEMNGRNPVEANKAFTTSTKHARERTLPSILHGYAEGMRLKVRGAAENLTIVEQEINNLIENKRLIDQGMKIKDAEGRSAFSFVHYPDYKEIQHPAFRKWDYAKKLDDYSAEEIVHMGTSRNFQVMPDGTVLEKKPIYAPAKIADGLNNILGRSKLLDNAGVMEAVTKANAYAKQSLLLFGFFHHLNFLRAHYLSTPGIMNHLNPKKAYKAGLDIIKEMPPEFKQMIDQGLTVGKDLDYGELYKGGEAKINNKILNAVGAGQAFNFLQAASHAQHRFLFEQLGAGLKTISAMEWYGKLAKDHPDWTPERVAKAAADLTNDNYGGQNLAMLHRNPTTQHIFRMLSLAPDWTESNIKKLSKAINPLSFKSDAAMAHRAMWGNVLLRGAAITIFANAAMSLMQDDAEPGEPANWSERFVDRYRRAWDAGKLRWTMMDVSAFAHAMGADPEKNHYFSLFGMYSDPIKLISGIPQGAASYVTDQPTALGSPKDQQGNAGDYFGSKSSPLFRLAKEFVTSQDWKGMEFTSVPEMLGNDDKGIYKTTTVNKKTGMVHGAGEDKGGQLAGALTKPGDKIHLLHANQIPSFALNQARGLLPIPLANTLKYFQGEMDGFINIANSLGAGIAENKNPDDIEEK